MVPEMRGTTDDAVHASPTAAIFRQPYRGFLIATIAALFMTVIGALGTDEVGFPKRLAYWLLVMESGAALGAIVSPVIRGWGRLEHRPIAEGLLVSLVIAIPLTILLIGANRLFFDAPGGWVEGVAIFGVVLMVSMLMTALNYSTAPTPVMVVAQAAQAAGQTREPRFTARLPLRLQHAAVHALEAQDHYLQVHTDAGSELILMRLSDAIDELDGLDGARCHRSWWVARPAVTDVIQRDGRVMLKLVGDLMVPVSRTYLPELRAGGWLTGRKRATG